MVEQSRQGQLGAAVAVSRGARETTWTKRNTATYSFVSFVTSKATAEMTTLAEQSPVQPTGSEAGVDGSGKGSTTSPPPTNSMATTGQPSAASSSSSTAGRNSGWDPEASLTETEDDLNLGEDRTSTETKARSGEGRGGGNSGISTKKMRQRLLKSKTKMRNAIAKYKPPIQRRHTFRRSASTLKNLVRSLGCINTSTESCATGASTVRFEQAF